VKYYGKGWECFNIDTTTTYYNVLNSPYQEMKYGVTIKQGGSTIASKIVTIEPRASSTVNIKGINMDFPGWLSRGASVPTKSYVIKDTKVWLRSTFLKDFYNIPYSFPQSPPAHNSWSGWLGKYGDCNTNYNAQQIFVTGITDHEGHKWIPPVQAPLPFSVKHRAMVGNDVYWYYALPFTATGIVTITLPKSFIGAQIVQLNRIMQVKITHVSGDFKTPYTAGETRYFYVTVKNSGNDGGNVQISAEGTDFYGTGSGYIKGDSEGVITVPVTSKFSPKGVTETVKFLAYAANKLQYTYTKVKLTIAKPNSQANPSFPNTPTSGGGRVVIISSNLSTFTGSNVYSGSVIGIGVKGIGIHTGNGIFQLKFENMHRDLFFPIEHSFTLVTSSTHTPAIGYWILLRAHITSEETMNVSNGGVIVAHNITEYSYTNPDIYLLLLIPMFFLILVGLMVHISLKRR